MTPLSDFERAVLEKLLTGGDPRLGAVHQQLSAADVIERKSTGVGLFLKVAVGAGVPAAAPADDFAIDGVHAEIEGLEHGAGFVAFVTRGFVDTLEGFTYDEPWPTRINSYRLAYDDETRGVSIHRRDPS